MMNEHAWEQDAQGRNGAAAGEGQGTPPAAPEAAEAPQKPQAPEEMPLPTEKAQIPEGERPAQPFAPPPPGQAAQPKGQSPEQSRATPPGAESPAPLERQEAARTAPTPQPAYAYRWSYAEQVASDQAVQRRRQSSRGAMVFAAVMSAAFLLCLAVLVLTLVLGGAFSTRSSSVADVTELVSPGTVLIYASGGEQAGYGTGFFVRSDGYIVTNYHVIEGAEQITVTLYSGRVQQAGAVWYSWADDLAILKIDGTGYPALTIGDSDTVRAGDLAVVVGNPAGDVAPWSTTQGIVSAVNRMISVEEEGAIVDMVMMQTDAQVNPGNSGGPLCNAKGEVIGIVTRKLSDYDGLGLAIPINGAMELINAYLSTGSTEQVVSSVSRVRPTMGIQVADIRKGDQLSSTDPYTAPRDGVLVVSITPGSASGEVLEPGDIILQMDGVDVYTVEDLRLRLYTHRAGETVELAVDRFGERLTLRLRLGMARLS